MPKLGTKNVPFLRILGMEFEKSIIKIEINTIEFF